MSLPVNAGQLHRAANQKGISRRASRSHDSGQVLALALLSIERSGMIAEHGLDRGALALAWCQSCIIASIASRVLGGPFRFRLPERQAWLWSARTGPSIRRYTGCHPRSLGGAAGESEPDD